MNESNHSRPETGKELPKLFIGPWVGEFGIEILHWQGLARAAARSRPWGEVVVSSWPDRRFLYEDFADRFVPFTPPSTEVCGAKCRGYDESANPWKDLMDPIRGDKWMTPFGGSQHFFRLRALAGSESLFRNFAAGTPPPDESFDLLLHARATAKFKQDYKNWPVSSWETLVSSLPGKWRVASIGNRNGAHKIAGTSDLRGIELGELAAHCRSARMLVGPSSGPVHFAMHCGLPVVIWMGEHRHHYYPQWNPEDVPVVCFDTWQPKVEDVLARIRDLHLIGKSLQSPIRLLILGTKRSGHHAVGEWMTRLGPPTYQIWLNDCVSRSISTLPHCRTTVPCHRLLPKLLSEPWPRDLVTESGDDRRPHQRVISMEGALLRDVRDLPEARAAERIAVVIRDSANLAASLRKTFAGEIAKEGPLGATMRSFLASNQDYLREATGRSAILGDLAWKTVFISYNRWHTDAAYRRLIAEALGHPLVDDPRGTVSTFGPRSAFQPRETKAERLESLTRWHATLDAQSVWVACRDAETMRMEREFHGEAAPLSRIDDAWAEFREA